MQDTVYGFYTWVLEIKHMFSQLSYLLGTPLLRQGLAMLLRLT